MPYKQQQGGEDKLLVSELILSRSEQAFKALYEKYRRDIYAYSRSLLKSDQNAEEIVQDVFLKLWSNSKNLDPNLSIKAYLFTIARNLSFNFLAKAANNAKLREEIFYNSQKTSDPAIDFAFDTDYDSLQAKAIDMLPPKRRVIFLMSRSRGMSYQDISEELGISTSTVKTQMSKALETLRSYLSLHTDLTISLILFLSYFV